MECRYGLWQGVSALFSQSRRQLGEENTRPFALNLHLPAERISCKYPGSRSGRQINMSALRIAMTNFDGALAITGAVGQYHRQAISRITPAAPITPDAPNGIWDLYIIARASIAIIAYQQRLIGSKRATNCIADDLASQYQFISGVFMICREMMNTADNAIDQNRYIPAQDLYAYADMHDIFISFNGMACAGSTKKIIDFLEFCNQIAPKNSGLTSGSDDGRDALLRELVDNPKGWYDYSIATIQLDFFIELERLKRLKDLEPDRAQHFDDICKIYQSMSRYCADLSPYNGVFNNNEPSDDIAFHQGLLERQNALLEILGRPAIKKISHSHITTRLGL